MRWTVLLLALASAASSQDTCLSTEGEPYLLFGTKTAYQFANKDIPNPRPQDIPGCQPEAIWLLNRNGAHNPEIDELAELEKLTSLRDNVIQNYKEGRNSDLQPRICQTDLALLNRWVWSPRHNATYAGDLTTSGYMQTQQLGQIWRGRYPGLFTNNKYDYLFKFATDRRSSESFRAFADGLFRGQLDSMDVPQDNDEKYVKPYKTCPAFVKAVEENNNTLLQRNIFESKGEFDDMVNSISHRLGFNYNIDRSIVQRIYQMCRYNKAWDITQPSPWCSAFSKEDLRHFEYAEDLETYNKYGYGLHAKLSAALGCVGVKDFVEFFRKHVEQDGPQQPRTVVQFVEAPMLLMLLTAMGARNSNAPLTGDNYHTATAQSRQWANSAMVPYNANLAAVLYKCNLNGNYGIKDRYQVLFLHNEQIMNLPNCKAGLCEWSYVNVMFGEIASKCNLEVCNGSTSMSLSSFQAVSVGLMGLFFSYALERVH